MRHIARLVIWTLCGIGTAAVPCSAQAPPPADVPSLSQDAQATIQQLLDLSRQQFVPSPAGRQEGQELRALFLDRLKTLDQQVDESAAHRLLTATDAGIAGNLVAMARDYCRNPEHYQELLQYYRARNLQARVLAPPPLDPKHATEMYRPTWELRLVAPFEDLNAGADDGHLRLLYYRAIEAIRNDRSIPVLEFQFRNAVDGIKRGSLGMTRSEVSWSLVTLSDYYNMPALCSILRCVTMAESVPELARAKPGGRTIREVAVSLLRDDNNGRELPRGRWREVIERALQDPELEEADQTLLREVLKAQEVR